MGSNWIRRPILVGFDDAWIENIIQDHLSMASWPRVPQEPNLKTDDGHSERKHIDHPAVQENSDHYIASFSPSSRQYHASEQAYSERYRPTTPLKCATDERTLQSANYGRCIQPSTEAQQDEAEETTQDILGPRITNLPTVQFILKLEATRMDPMEWVAAKQIIEIEPKAGKNLFLLAKLFDQDAKATKKEEKEKASTILRADGLH